MFRCNFLMFSYYNNTAPIIYFFAIFFSLFHALLRKFFALKVLLALMILYSYSIVLFYVSYSFMSYFLGVFPSILSVLTIRKLKYANALRIELGTGTLQVIFAIYSVKVSVMLLSFSFF